MSMEALLTQIEINTRGGGGGGSTTVTTTSGGGGGGPCDSLPCSPPGCGGGGGGGLPGMDMCSSCPLPGCGGGDSGSTTTTTTTGGGESKKAETNVTTTGGGSDSMGGCIECPGLTGALVKDGGGTYNKPPMCPTPGNFTEWRIRRYRYCCKMQPDGCWEGICGNDRDTRWDTYGYYDSYIGGNQKDCVKGGDEKGPWNAPNICVGSKMCAIIPCKVHIRRCCCCCECCCCDCGEIKTSTIGCQQPCLIPEDLRCVHCTCGLFPTMCHPVVHTLCCGDWEKIQPGDENVPDHLDKAEMETCCRCGCAGPKKADS